MAGFLEHKRGTASDSGVLFFVFFAMMLIIGFGIVSGVLTFYGKGYDFRHAEANSLLLKIEDCLINYDGRISNDFDLYSECRLNKNVIEESYLVIIREAIERDELFVAGKRSFEEQSKLNAKNAPVGVKKEIVIDGFRYEIFVASDQDSRSVIP